MKCSNYTSKTGIQEITQLVNKTRKSANSGFRNWKQKIHTLKWLHCVYQPLCSKRKTNLRVDLQELNRDSYSNRCVRNEQAKWYFWKEDAQRRG